MLSAVPVLIGQIPDRAAVVLTVGLFTPGLVDLALAVVGPIERRLSARFVDQATVTLARIDPIVVAITGSYGKTTTKADPSTLRDSRATVASPASFNNRMGLARRSMSI